MLGLMVVTLVSFRTFRSAFCTMMPRTMAAGPEEILYRRRSTAIASRTGGYGTGPGRELLLRLALGWRYTAITLNCWAEEETLRSRGKWEGAVYFLSHKNTRSSYYYKMEAETWLFQNRSKLVVKYASNRIKIFMNFRENSKNNGMVEATVAANDGERLQ